MIKRMDMRRTRRLLAAYGADPARWPEAERARLARGDAPDLEEARALDRALDGLQAPPPDPLLADRLLARAAGLPQERPAAARRITFPWRLGLGWPEVAAMAAAVLLGLVVGWSDVLPVTPAADQDVVVISRLDGLE